MVTKDRTPKKALLHLLKDFSGTHTITTVAKALGLSRVGAWKVLKRLESEKYVILTAVGKGKTSTCSASLNWKNPLVEKALSLYLTEEAMQQRRWQVNFAGVESIAKFVLLYGSILHSPKEAGDIDLLGIIPKKKFVKLQVALDKVQKTQSKKIHAVHFTDAEFQAELKKENKAFIDAIKKGVVLFGQEQFVMFMKEMAT